MRKRSYGLTTVGPIYCGETSFDLTYPYGDGPWSAPTVNYWGPNITYSTYEKQCYDELHPGPPYRIGGPLDIYEYSTNQYEVMAIPTKFGKKYRYIGGVLPAEMPSDYLGWASLEAFKASDAGDSSSYGAAGWNRFRPTRPGVDLGIFLGEFRDVPRMLKGTAKAFHDMWRAAGGSLTGFAPKSVANHWLNTQFGWRPFLNDLRKFARTTKLLDTKLKRLRKNNGKWERRGGSLEGVDETDTPVDSSGSVGLTPASVSYLYDLPYGSRKVVTSTSQKIWFEGAFKYWIPGKPDTWYWKARAMAMIYGLTPSPSLVWELTPWSWLIDWWADAGDAIANLSSIMFDSLAAKYAFVMAQTEYKSTYTGTSLYKSGPETFSWFASYTRKTRHAASPFGFGLTGDDFDARQWSILSALGLTRLGR